MGEVFKTIKKEGEKRVTTEVLEKSGKIIGTHVSRNWGVKLTKMALKIRQEK